MKKNIIAASVCAALVIIAVFAVIFGLRGQNYTPKIVFMPKEYSDTTTDFWVLMMNGARAAAEELDLELVVLAPEHEIEYEVQQRYIEEAVAMKPAAIVLSPCSLTETYEYAHKIEEAGIPLVLVDSRMEKEAGSCVVSTDNIHAGTIMGEYLANKMTEDDYIGIIAHVKGISTAVEREQGVRQGLGVYEDRIVEVVFSNSDYEIAYSETKKMITEHPEITMLAGLNEYSAVGAARAIKDMGRGDITMIGFDSSLEEIQLLEEGIFDAIVVQYPFNMGYLGVLNARNLAKGEQVIYEVDSGTSLIMKDDLYKEENQKNLFPFN